MEAGFRAADTVTNLEIEAQALRAKADSRFEVMDDDELLKSWLYVFPSKLDPSSWDFVETIPRNGRFSVVQVVSHLLAATSGENGSGNHRKSLDMLLNIASVQSTLDSLHGHGVDENRSLESPFYRGVAQKDDEVYVRSCVISGSPSEHYDND